MRPSLRSTYHSTIKRTCLFIFHRLNDKDMQFYTTRLDISLQFDYYNSYVHSYTMQIYVRSYSVRHLVVYMNKQKLFCTLHSWYYAVCKRYFAKKIVKITFLLKELLKSCFHEIFFQWERISLYSTLHVHIHIYVPTYICMW